MRSRYKFIETEGLYFITATVVQWIPVFTNEKYFKVIMESLCFCQKQNKFNVHAWVILENHLHLIISGCDLSDGIRDFKSYTAKRLITLIKEDRKAWLLNQLSYYRLRYKTQSQYQFWQEGVHPQLIKDEAMWAQKVDYIHQNPVTRGYVLNPEDWKYSSARDFIEI